MASTTSSKRPKKKQHSLKELKTLGLQLLTSRSHINNLPLLLAYVSPNSPPQYALESLLSLHSFFTPLLPDLPRSSSSKSHDDADHIYRTWLRSKFQDLLRSLFDLILSTQADDALREVALDTLMEFVKLGNRGCFSYAIYHRLLVTLVDSTTPVDFVLDLLASKYFAYIDVRYFTYISLEKLVASLESRNLSDEKTGGDKTGREDGSKPSMELSIHNIHYIISHIPPLEDKNQNSDEELWSGSGFQSKGDEPSELSEPLKTTDNHLKSKNHKDNVLPTANFTKKMKLKFTKAWISFLRLPLPLDVYKEVLANLHLSVIPYLSNPLMLSDFLTRSYDIGGVISVMALSSLFILITQHGLEYPDFYEKLYVLLLPSIFVAKHRAKFFQLLDSCLKSPLLPAYLAAAFTKKLSRLSVVVPPSGALVIIALIHNLLRRHPSINCLVHQEYDYDIDESNSEAKIANSDVSGTCTDMSATKPGLDCFDNEERNPAKSHALRSSLWEIDDLRQHYCPPVSRFVLSLENDLTVRAKTTEVNIEDFSSGSYATIFGEEIRRRVKQVPLAFYKSTPKSLFSETDFAGWTFQHVESNEKHGAQGNDESAAKRKRMG